MTINVLAQDRNHNNLEIGDTVELFDWGSGISLGIVTICFDFKKGCISSDPCIVDDTYDFWTKCLPLYRKLSTGELL